MKKVLAAVLSLAMAFSLAGCSLFTGGGNGGDASNGAVEVKISDAVTHQPPADIEYATQYVLYSGETCAVADMFKDQHNVTLTAEYIIIYASEDDVALAQYTYYVFDSEEDAAKYQEIAEGFNLNAETTGNVTCNTMDQEAMTDSIDSFIAWTVLEDTSAAAYVEMYKEMDSLIDYIPE